MNTKVAGCWITAWVVCAACQPPPFETELHEAGPPEPLAVTVLGESLLFEVATWCTDDPEAKAPTHFCPVEGPVADALPTEWYARVVFDELLDANAVEELGDEGPSIAGADPFTVVCADEELPYDGFYDPSGNHLTVPAGPSLVVAPGVFVATGAACTVQIEDGVVDASGQAVPPEARGPFEFAIAPLAVIGAEPADDAEAVDPLSTPVVAFNAPIDSASIAGRFHLSDDSGEVETTAAVSDADPTVVVVTPAAQLAEETTYTLDVDAGIADVAGGALEAPVAITFTTGTATSE